MTTEARTTSLHMKSYFAETVDEARQRARLELGEDAMLVDARQTPAEHHALGRYEVIFAADPVPSLDSRDVRAARAESCFAPNGPHSARERLSGISQDLRELADWLGRTATAKDAILPGEESRWLDRLVAFGVSLESAQAVLQDTGRRMGEAEQRSHVDYGRLLLLELERRISVEATLNHAEGGTKIVMLVGPNGCGKTTTLVKLAAQGFPESLESVQLLSLDSYRIGACDQLRAYSDLLDVGFEQLEDSAGLLPALGRYAHKKLVLVDTPGYGPWNADEFRGLEEALLDANMIEVHLVLPASMKAEDMARACKFFGPLRPGRLLFTRLDETCALGSVLGAALETGIPLSYFANGPRIPEDLEPASVSRLIAGLYAGDVALERVAA